MEKFIDLTAVAAPMPAANVDTDVIMPKAFLKRIDKEGVLEGLFHDLKKLPSGEENPKFILNQDPYQKAEILLTGPNFGCGSSREHAVWGLQKQGIRVLIGSSFAGIFFDNCANNGLLCITLPQETMNKLFVIQDSSVDKTMTVDLKNQFVRDAEGNRYSFDIDINRKAKLMEGIDEVGEVLRNEGTIENFEQQYFERYPWLDASE